MIESKQLLGITIDQHLSLKPNIKNICKKITSGISTLHRVKPLIAEKETFIFISYTMLLYGRTSIIVLKFGMYLVNGNASDYKSYKTELLVIIIKYEQ